MGSKNIDGARVEKICDKVMITLNKNSVPGDKSALNPGGMRLGAHAMTSRGFKEAQFKTKTVKDYVGFLATDPEINAKCQALKNEVNEFALKYPMPGFDGH